MSAVRNLITDLVDRRLWPVAVALLGALVAVPVLLGGGSKAPAPAPAAPLAAAAGTAGGTAQAAVSLSQPSTSTTSTNRPGAVRNPFTQHHVPAPASQSAPTTPTPSAPSTPTGGSAPSAPTGGGVPVVTTPIVPGSGGGKRDATETNVWRVNLRFGEAGDQKTHKDIPRLSPLPSATDPFFIFLGVLADGKTAVFLISSDTTATGDGKCKPTPEQCDTIEMRAGDTEFFDVAQGNAGVTQYELDLLKVFKNTVKGKAAAAKASRVSKDGQNVVKELKAEGHQTGYGRYIWSAKRGVLVRRHGLRVKASASSAGTGQTPGAQMSSVFGATWTGTN
jgi:hypothetical protein